MPRCLSVPADRIVAAILLTLAGCAGISDRESVQISVIEASVWCDRMLGSPPRAHAVMRCMIMNLREDSITVYPGDGVISDARTGRPLRRFTCALVLEDRETTMSHIPPRAGRELTFRTPRQRVMPFDIADNDLVRLLVFANTSRGDRLTIESDTLQPFLTE